MTARPAARYGEKMRALLIAPDTRELNGRGMLLLDTRGRRIAMVDTLEHRETISFMVGSAGG